MPCRSLFTAWDAAINAITILPVFLKASQSSFVHALSPYGCQIPCPSIQAERDARFGFTGCVPTNKGASGILKLEVGAKGDVLGFRAFEDSFSGVRDYLPGFQRPIVDSDFMDHPLHWIVLVFIPISGDIELGLRWIIDRTFLAGVFTLQFAVHEDPHPFTVICTGNVIPAPRLKGVACGQVSHLDRLFFGSDRKAKTIMAIPQDPPAFVVAVILNRPHDSAPLKGLVHTHPGFCRYRLGR